MLARLKRADAEKVVDWSLQTVEILQGEQARRKVEFYALLDANKKVIASANSGQVCHCGRELGIDDDSI